MPTTSDDFEYKIEKGHPLPGPIVRPGMFSNIRQTLREMEVGDSCLIYGTAQINSARSAAQREKRETGRVYTYRTTGNKVYRLWRVE